MRLLSFLPDVNAPTSPLRKLVWRPDSALNIFMDVKRTDRKASLASVAGEVEMEEQGDGAKLLKSKARTFSVGVSCVSLSYLDARDAELGEYDVSCFVCRHSVPVSRAWGIAAQP